MIIINSTIPSDFEPNSGTSNYLRLLQGKHRIRILSGAVAGYVWWTDSEDGGRKPHRIPMDGKPPVEFAESLRRFIAFPIWNYELNRVQIWEITQNSIQKELKAYEADKDWGSLLEYDLEIERTGNDKLNTRYRVSPKPKAPLDKDIESKIEGLPVMDALYDGSDPFTAAVDENGKYIKEEVEPESLPF